MTDQLVKEPPANLKIKQLTLPALRAKFQRKISFPIRLHQPYKICDYRPAFGWLLADWLKDYRYWGYCDLDQVMGRLAEFVPASLLAKYDKLYQNGHLTIFRNTVTNNLRFMARGGMDYRRVFQTDVACVFDNPAQVRPAGDQELSKAELRGHLLLAGPDAADQVLLKAQRPPLTEPFPPDLLL